MGPFDAVDWREVFVPDTPLLEIFVRGSCVYLALFLIMRVVMKRQTGALRMADLIVVVLVADAAQNAMTADYTAIPDGILLVLTIAFWSHAMDWLGYRFPFIQSLIYPSPLTLVENGKLMRKHMKSELITEDELMAQLREQGIDDIAEVKRACMEGDGHVSVVTHDDKRHNAPEKSAV
jgi:uncharacterized membrane protein YcaP (DUF421 family)